MTIRIFFADGEPTGILLAGISNWTGKVVVTTCSKLSKDVAKLLVGLIDLGEVR